MIPFFSSRFHRKEQIAGRAVVTAAAFLFLCTALLSTLPSKDRLTDLLEVAGLSGYRPAETTAASRPDRLEEFYDRPLTEGDDHPGIPSAGAPVAEIRRADITAREV